MYCFEILSGWNGEKMDFSSLSDMYNLVVDKCVEVYDISTQARELWLDPLIPVDIKGEKVILATKSDFQRDTLNNIFREKLAAQFSDIMGVNITVEFVIRPELFQTPHTVDTSIVNKNDEEITNLVNKGKTPYTFETFIIGPSNNLAFAAAKAVAQKQHDKYNPLFIYGASGLGKTHLLSAIQHYMTNNYPGSNIIYISAETFTNEFLHSISANTTEQFDQKYKSADALLIDDIQFIAGKEQTEEKVFHIFNELYKLNKPIVLTSDRPAKEIKSISDRLKTRFSSGLAADVKPPEYETRMAIIRRKAELLDFKLPNDVVDFIASKLKSNIRQIEGVVTKMNALYVVSQTKPSIVVAQTVIKDEISDHQPIPVTVEKIINEVANIFNVSPDEMRSGKRTANVSNARKVAIYVIQEVTGLSYDNIGKEFGGRDHSTIVYSIKNVKDQMMEDSNFQSIVDDLIKNIKANQ